MFRKTSTLTALFLFLSYFSFAQLQPPPHLNIDIGINGGAGYLIHKTRFETTPLYNQYLIIKEVFSNQGLDYTWGMYEEDFGLRDRFIQPRFGFSALLTYGNLPFYVGGELMSSPSSYQKTVYGLSVGVGEDFYVMDSTSYFSFRGGYKFVKDFGFGSKTLVNSVGDESIRENLATFFDPKEPLGDSFGRFFTLNAGYGIVLGEQRRMRIGVDLFGELDLTSQTERESRMTNVGALLYVRFRM
ncbi:MAG: hypothetical protein R2792_04275 [Saprospiraceae bacterium]